MNGRLLATLMLAPVCFLASAATYFASTPTDDRFPANMTASNVSGVVPWEHGYKHGYTTGGWTVETVDGSSYSFVAPSHTESGSPVDSWLTTAPFIVESEDAWLRWKAKSVLPGFPECYDVVVTAFGEEPVTVAGVSEENVRWQTHLVSLADFTGKEVRVSFVCRSCNRYMLAVKDIFAGVFDSVEWEIDNTTSRYAAIADGAIVRGSVTNTGADAGGAAIVCRVGDTETVIDSEGKWLTGTTREYNFDIPVALNESTAYSIGISCGGEFVSLVSSEVFVSHFERILLVDEGTGMWCNNCPDGILELDRLKEEFGNNIIELSCHVYDPLAMPDYWGELKFYAVPYMMLNRNRDTMGSSSRNFSKEYNSPVMAGIRLPENVTSDGETVTLEGEVTFARDIDNAGGRYKVGYAVVADIFDPGSEEYYQQNNLTMPRACQYYILPTVIAPTLARFDNAVIEDSHAFCGVDGSIPENIIGMTGNQFTLTAALPEIASDAENVRVVAYVIDTASGMILNAAVCNVAITNGIGQTSSDSNGRGIILRILPSGRVDIDGVDDRCQVEVTVSDTQGKVYDRISGTASEIAGKEISFPSGISIVTAFSPCGTSVAKHISRNSSACGR